MAFQIGLAVDAVLSTSFFRGLIKEFGDLTWFLRCFTLVLITFVIFVAMESVTGDNVLHSNGGLSGHLFEMINIVVLVVFASNIIGDSRGEFSAFVLWIRFLQIRSDYAILGAILCLSIVLFSNSGGPLNAVFVGVTGWLLMACAGKNVHW